MRKTFAMGLTLSLALWNVGAPLPAQALQSEFRQVSGAQAQGVSGGILAGMEEAPAYDVLGEINARLADSPYLKAIEAAREWHPAADMRNLMSGEIDQLKKNGNSSQDWSRVRVTVGTNLNRIKNSTFIGDVEIGSTEGEVEVDGVRFNAGIYGSTVANSRIGDHMFIFGGATVLSQVVKENVVIVDTWVAAQGETAFGNKTEIPVAIETGGREVKPFAEMLLDAATRQATSRGDKALLEEFGKAHAQYVRRATSTVGIVEEGARIIRAVKVKNTYVGQAAVIADGAIVEGSTILSGPGKEVATVTGHAIVEGSILQWGASAESQAIVKNSVLLEHSHAERQGKVTDSILGPNTGVAEGEVTANLLGPFVGFHHQAILIATLWPEGKGNVASGADVGSNHTSKAPDQEFWPGEGLFLGLGVKIKYPSNFRNAPYSIIAGGVSALPQKVEFPFSLVNTPSKSVPGISPAYNEIILAWVLTDNLYTLKRNEGKYKDRDKSKRHKFNFNVFRPDTVRMMYNARTRLVSVALTPTPANGVYTDEQIPGLGKNFMKAEYLPQAINAYDRFILNYALNGLLEKVEALDKAGEKTKIADLLTQEATDDPLWEDQRQTLLRAWPGVTVSEGLRRVVEMEKENANAVEQSKDKDNVRGHRIIDDYDDVQQPAAKDKFVKKTHEAAADLEKRVTGQGGLLARIAGLEEKPQRAARPASMKGLARQMNQRLGIWASDQDPERAKEGIPFLVAGTQTDEKGRPGLAYGLVLARMGFQVGFVVDTEEEQALLRESGIVEAWRIARIDNVKIFTAKKAVEELQSRASARKIVVENVVSLGVEGPITEPLVQWVLELGVRLPPQVVPTAEWLISEASRIFA